MPSPKERLCHLLELAAQGAGERVHLADEVADLLLNWPSAYPAEMRATFEALLEKIVGEMAPGTAHTIAARFEGRDDVPLSLLNALFLSASAAMQDDILKRNDMLAPAEESPLDGEALLAAARATRDFAPELARLAGLRDTVAEAVLADPSGRGLAVVAKAGGMTRATFSAMAILAGPARSVADNFALLGVYDCVPENGARHLFRLWLARTEHSARAAA